MFYEKLYTAPMKQNDANLDELFISNEKIKILTNEDRQICDAPISIKECGRALKLLKNNKSAGCDRFPAEFYKFFWNKINFFLIKSFMWSYQNNQLSTNQKRGITLVPKKGKDLCSLKNWRPVSLLNIDYKILTKVLAQRLQIVLKQVINPDQVGYITDRFMGENIRTTADILTYCNLTDKSALMTLIDFEKAFDTVSWSFLFKSLKAFNFGDSFIKWIKIIYSNIQSCVTNNGKSSNFFQLERGIRQGCCLSALLFIIVVELLATSIRSVSNIKGISINCIEFKISQLADDTCLYLNDVESLGNALAVLDNFAVCSGLKVNKEKTEVIPLNFKPVQEALFGVSWKCGNFTMLGVWFSQDKKEMTHLNLNKRLVLVYIFLNIPNNY